MSTQQILAEIDSKMRTYDLGSTGMTGGAAEQAKGGYSALSILRDFVLTLPPYTSDMKKLVWFREGEPIPVEAKFVGEKRQQIEGHDHHRVTFGHTEYLYEVPCD